MISLSTGVLKQSYTPVLDTQLLLRGRELQLNDKQTDVIIAKIEE
jgi:hypothetical protein